MDKFTKAELISFPEVQFQKVYTEVTIDDYIENEVDKNLVRHIKELDDYYIGVSTSQLPPNHEFFDDEMFDFKFLLNSYDYGETFCEHLGGYSSSNEIKYLSKDDATLLYAAVKKRYLKVEQNMVALMKRMSSLNKIPPLENVIIIDHIEKSPSEDSEKFDPFA